MKNAGLPAITQVRASGGGVKSALWRQILAGVLQAEIVTINTAEGAAYGAAILSVVGTGAFESVESACQQIIQVTGRTTPGGDTAVYDQIYPLYRQLYPALKPTFTETGKR